MAAPTQGPLPKPPPEGDDPRWELARKIASSGTFKRAAKLRAFLLYVVDQALSGHANDLNEQQIGQMVYGRSRDYSPSEDNVVRVHARQLRIKLQEYFVTEGKDEPLVLDIPKGSYVPVFASRPPGAVSVHTRAPRRIGAWQVLVMAVAAAGVITSVLLWLQVQALKRPANASAGQNASLVAPLAWVFGERQPTYLVVADSCFGLVQDLLGRRLSLDDYLRPGPVAGLRPQLGGAPVESLLGRVRTRQLTSYADALLTARIIRLAGGREDRLTVRFARDVRLRDLAGANFIFLGSSYSNPWVSLFEKRMNFRIDYDAATGKGYVRNTAPRPGEKASYLMKGEDGVTGETFGIIAFLPADNESGNVLIVAGTNMEGTEAAGAELTNPRQAAQLLSAAGIASRIAGGRYFESLLQATALEGSSRETRIVASRSGS